MLLTVKTPNDIGVVLIPERKYRKYTPYIFYTLELIVFSLIVHILNSITGFLLPFTLLALYQAHKSFKKLVVVLIRQEAYKPKGKF